jgi:hypothetical protein
MAITGTGAYGAMINSGLAGGGTGATSATSTVASATAATKRVVNGNSNPDVIVSLSNSALAALRAQQNADTGNYAAYFPARAGFDTGALAAAVGDPGATGSSAGKSFAAVAADARARMDAKYAAMTAAGQPYDPDSAEGRDGYALMGDLDRRSLYAVSSNADGLFSPQEQNTAKSIMSQQMGLAMGLYTGPTSQAKSFADPFANDTGARFAAAEAFLADVSAEEKQSAEWARQRALVSMVTSQSESASAQPMNLFGILAAADKEDGGIWTLFDRGTTDYAQLANQTLLNKS